MVRDIKEFQLNKIDADFIIKHFSEYNKNMIDQANSYVMRLDSEEQQNLINNLTDLLVSEGLNANDEPNKVGMQIEHLIDIFNPYKK